VAALAAGNDIPASRVEAVLGLFGPYSSLGMAQPLGIDRYIRMSEVLVLGMCDDGRRWSGTPAPAC
jgi:hypothetical protein